LMETPPHSSAAEERLKAEIESLRKTIRSLEREIARLRARLVSAWGSDE